MGGRGRVPRRCERVRRAVSVLERPRRGLLEHADQVHGQAGRSCDENVRRSAGSAAGDRRGEVRDRRRSRGSGADAGTLRPRRGGGPAGANMADSGVRPRVERRHGLRCARRTPRIHRARRVSDLVHRKRWRAWLLSHRVDSRRRAAHV